MKTLLFLALGLCAAVAANAETQFFNAYDFEFESGSVLPELRVAYETQGNLAPGRDNAILLVHGGSGDRHAFDPVIDRVARIIGMQNPLEEDGQARVPAESRKNRGTIRQRRNASRLARIVSSPPAPPAT